MTKHLLSFAFLLFSMSMNAQMTFTYSVSGVTTSKDADGVTRIIAPSGTNLSNLIAGVSVDGASVTASSVSPNPTTTKIYADRLEVFTYNNKAYAFRFDTDDYFTAVFISDCHTGQTDHDGTSVSDLTAIMNNICSMGSDGKQKVKFSSKPNFVPKADIIFCLGDIDQDKGDDGSKGKHTNFLGATAEVAKTAGIPFIFIAGNHDLSPDYWGSSNSDRGVTSGNSGGANADSETISAIKSNNSYWNSNGGFDEGITYFTTGNNRYFEPNHFTFKFKGVRFYCANNYWFQKPYAAPGLLSAATYYAPDPIVNNLNTFVESHASEASVWMQHFPWLAGNDCNRWWLDQNSGGYYITTTNSSAYGSNTSGIAYNDANSANTLKKNPLTEIMMKAAGKVNGQVQHFSGHYHQFNDATYTSTVNSNNQVHDYTVAAPGYANEPNNAFVVLMKRGVGVVEVKKTQF